MIWLQDPEAPRPTPAQDLRDPRWETDLHGRFTTAICSVLSIALFASAVPRWNSRFVEATGSKLGVWQDVIPLILVCEIPICRDSYCRSPFLSWMVDEVFVLALSGKGCIYVLG